MVTKSGRRWLFAAGLVSAWMLAMVPSFADAQGLLPNLPTRYRQKPACASEPPFYATVRHQYFGYYPTCWRQFPPGWTCPCPNPERPNFQQSLQARKLRDDAPGDGEGAGGAGGANNPAGPAEDSDLPAPADMPLPDQPSGRSPFDTPADPKPTTPPPSGLDEPLDSDRSKAPVRGPGASTSARTPAAPVLAAAVPVVRPSTHLDLPLVAAAAPELAPLVEAGAPSPAGFEPPLAAASDAEAQPFPSSAPPEDAAPMMPPAPEPTTPVAVAANNGSLEPAIAPPPLIQGTPAPVSAPRRSVIGGMFNRFRRR